MVSTPLSVLFTSTTSTDYDLGLGIHLTEHTQLTSGIRSTEAPYPGGTSQIQPPALPNQRNQPQISLRPERTIG
jgi:hypothetical protein